MRAVPVVIGLTLLFATGACGGGSHSAASTTTHPPAATSGSTAGGCVRSSGTASGSPSGGDASPPGDIPDNIAFIPFVPARGRYTLRIPEGWARTDEADGGVSFSDKLDSIRVALVPASTPPTADTARTTEVPAIRQAAKCFERVRVSTVTRHGQSVVHIAYRADGPADPVTGRVVHDDLERYEYWAGGTEAVVTLSGPVGSDNVDAWKLVSESFRWT